MIRTTRARAYVATVAALLSILSPHHSKAFAATAPNSYALVQRAIDGYVLPHIAELKLQTERLALSVDQLCQNGAEAS